MKHTIKYTLFSLLLFIFSCSPDDEWKEPVNVNFTFDINKEDDSQSQLIFLNGSVNISEFSFEGQREQGDEVFFSTPYDPSLALTLNSNRTVSELKFEIPQGVYTKIAVKFTTSYSSSKEEKNSIFLQGTIKLKENSKPADDTELHKIVVQVESDQYFSCIAKNVDSESKIILSNENTSSANILIDPYHWFQVVPLTLWEKAIHNLDSISPHYYDNTIYIDKENNTEIYQLIVSRINESAKVTFN